ncbi:DUF2285 domain-containing protein [Asticcacaulis endophyticus]|uniref:DUF2285 domain-containing protein n=1 Tax=Asticcacaulis endophyticus TaxID=1395890 RepID=UPI001677FC36|nr:DUF2285 domain-containing protein [Asticcacaulis endophyticus]
MSIPQFLDQAPQGPNLTDYDRLHVKTYARLLDAVADNADWQEVVAILFSVNADAEPDRAKLMYDTHLTRAKWMTETGFRFLASTGISNIG